MMIETPKAVENAAAIGAVPGIDCLLVGSNDLSMEMGIPGDWRIPRSRVPATRWSPPVASTASGRVWAVPTARSC
jgi:2-keto-3-deoxy-L-rhamnonate aldolase RhmA